MPTKARVPMNEIQTSGASARSPRARPMSARRVGRGVVRGTRWGSGSRRQATAKLAAASPAATKKGSRGLAMAKSAPSAGPITKPRPKAAPIMPIPRVRFSGVVTSAT